MSIILHNKLFHLTRPLMEDFYQNKTICITGASRGIGLEILKNLISLGSIVHSVSRTEPPLKNERHFFHQANLSEPAIPGALLDISFDIIILNAGSVPKRSTFDDLPLDMIEQAIQMNILAQIRFMKRLTYKKVVLLNSVVADIGVPDYSIYCACKAFIACLNEALILEGKDTYIIKPYKVDTMMAPEMSTFCQLKKDYVAKRILTDVFLGKKSRITPWIFSLFPFVKSLLPSFVLRFLTRMGGKILLKPKVD